MPGLSPTELHGLLALGDGPSYGYRLQKRIETESGGAVRPDIGALYRTLGRLMDRGWVEEVAAPEGTPESTPGRTRRYYDLTAKGRTALVEEVQRLTDVVALARRRDISPERAG